MRASVSLPRSPTSTTRESPKRCWSFSIWTLTVLAGGKSTPRLGSAATQPDLKERHDMDPRTTSPGTDRWLTDSRVYNLIWLGRWVERAQNVARMLLWAAEHEATNDLEDLLGMAADIRGITVADDDSALEVLLTRDSGGSLRGCLEAARYNATHVAPVEVIRIVGTAIETLNRHDPASSPADAATLMRSIWSILATLTSCTALSRKFSSIPMRSPRKRSTAASYSNSSSSQDRRYPTVADVGTRAHSPYSSERKIQEPTMSF